MDVKIEYIEPAQKYIIKLTTEKGVVAEIWNNLDGIEILIKGFFYGCGIGAVQNLQKMTGGEQSR